jgi:hypothetical protein
LLCRKQSQERDCFLQSNKELLFYRSRKENPNYPEKIKQNENTVIIEAVN